MRTRFFVFLPLQKPRHASWGGSDGVGGSVLNVIYKLLCLFARQLDVVLLAEIIHSVGDFLTSVSTLLRSEQESQSSAGDATAEECANVT